MPREVLINEDFFGNKKPGRKISKMFQDRAEQIEAELKETQMARMLEEERQRLEETKSKGKSVEVKVEEKKSEESSDIIKDLLKNPDFHKKFMDLPEENRQSYLDAVSRMQMMTDPAMSKMLPFTIQTMMPAAAKGMTVKDMIDFGNYTLELISKTNQPDPDKLTTKEVLTLLLNQQNKAMPVKSEEGGLVKDLFTLFIDEVKSLREQALNRPSLIDELKQAKTIFTEFTPPPSTNNIDVEKARIALEQFKVEKELELQRWQIETQLQQQQLTKQNESKSQRDEKLFDMITHVFQQAKPIIQKGVKRLSDEVETAGQKQLRQPRTPASMKMEEETGEKTLICGKCQAKIPIPEPIPDKIKCAKCDMVYERQQ